VKLLHLLPSLGYTSAARQVALLAPVLRSRHGMDVHVATLRPDGRAAAWLPPDVPVHSLAGRFPPSAVQNLRRLVFELRPDVIHAWRLPALRAAAVLHRLGGRFRLVVGEPRRDGRMLAFDRWFLRSADVFIGSYKAEKEQFQQFGIAADRIVVLPLAVAAPPAEVPPLPVELPSGTKVVMCVGNLTAGHAFRDAAWAADVLRYALPHLHIVIIGDGPDRDRIERFARGVNPSGGQLHFVPARPDAAALLARADAVWAPSRLECGRQVVLEAQAAGRPVVASVLPGLAALIDDGRTGLLAPPGQPVVFARRARPLFEDPAFAERIGKAAGEAVAEHLPATVAAEYARLYAASA
jgi:glycosyltransferase involved in cell wall biosynthesis